MTQELSREQKLDIIDRILDEWKQTDKEHYICWAIESLAPKNMPALQAIPELEKVRPEKTDPNARYGWFGKPQGYGNIRTKALLKVRQFINEEKL